MADRHYIRSVHAVYHRSHAATVSAAVSGVFISFLFDWLVDEKLYRFYRYIFSLSRLSLQVKFHHCRSLTEHCWGRTCDFFVCRRAIISERKLLTQQENIFVFSCLFNLVIYKWLWTNYAFRVASPIVAVRIVRYNKQLDTLLPYFRRIFWISAGNTSFYKN